MTIRNGYISRTEYLNWMTPPSQTAVANTADDAVIDSIIEQVSRLIDQITSRHFYPNIETRYFDVPSGDLILDDDLLAVTTLTNGDAEVLTTTDYILREKNFTPYWKVAMKDISTKTWEDNSSGSSEQVISLLGTWGYHDDYAQAWEAVTTLAEDIDISELPWDLTAVTRLGVGSILKVDSEIVIVSSIATLTCTMMKRGDNGSTAATHSNGATIYLWKPIPPIVNACYQIVHNIYKRRFGENVNSVATVTGAGVVISPKDIPDIASKIMSQYTRLV